MLKHRKKKWAELLALTLFVCTQSLWCIEENRSKEQRNCYSEPSSHVQGIEKIEAPILISFGCFGALMKGNPRVKPLAVAFTIFVALMSHLEYAKLLLLSSYHRTELQSFYSQPPVDAVYELQVTMKSADLSETKTFCHRKPLQLIQEVTHAIHVWAQQNQKNNATVTITLSPSIITNRGRTITLSSRSVQWDEREGIEKNARRAFFFTKNGSLTHQAFSAAAWSAANCALLFMCIALAS